jgi:hypothetical protein
LVITFALTQRKQHNAAHVLLKYPRSICFHWNTWYLGH